MTTIKNPKTEVAYWDEHNKTEYPWYKKGKMKRILRKRWFAKRFKDLDKDG